MPNGSKPGFLQGMWGRARDAIALGDNYNRQTGEFNATPGQWIGGIATRGLGALAPGLGTIAHKMGDSYYNTGSLIPTGNGPLARLLGRGTQQGLDQALGNSQSNMMAQINAHNGFAAPTVMQATLPPPTDTPTTPPVNTQAPWQAMNPFAPGSGLAFAGAPQGRPIGGNLGFGGGRGGYNNGVGAGTGFGAANFTNDAFGDVARSFGVGGMSGGSRDMQMPTYRGMK